MSIVGFILLSVAVGYGYHRSQIRAAQLKEIVKEFNANAKVLQKLKVETDALSTKAKALAEKAAKEHKNAEKNMEKMEKEIASACKSLKSEVKDCKNNNHRSPAACEEFKVYVNKFCSLSI